MGLADTVSYFLSYYALFLLGFLGAYIFQWVVCVLLILLTKTKEKELLVIGHRGVGRGKKLAPGMLNHFCFFTYKNAENTLKAFQTAKDFGLKSVEFDVQLSKDGVPVKIMLTNFRFNTFIYFSCVQNRSYFTMPISKELSECRSG